MMSHQRRGVLSRRRLLRAGSVGALLAGAAPLFQACGAAQPQVVEKPVERVVTQVVEKPVEKIVERTVVVMVTVPPAATKAPIRQLKLATDWNAGVRKRIMDAIKPEFEKNNANVKIEHWHMGDGGTSGMGGYTDIIVAQLATGTAADVIMEVSYAPHVQHFVEIGPDLASLGWKKEDHILVENPGPILEGKQYGIPINTVITGWVYNEDLFAKEGLQPPTANWTFDDMFTAAQALTKPSEQQFGVHARNYLEWGYGDFIWPEGAEFFAQDGSKMLLCEGGAPDIFQWYVDLTFKHKVSPNPAETSAIMAPGLFEPFASGKIGMAPAGVYLIGFLQDSIGQRFKMALMPTPKSPRTGKRAHFLAQAVAVIPKVSQERGNYEEAVKYAAFFTSDFVQKMYAEQRPSAPSSKKWLQSPEYRKAPPNNMDLVWANYSGGGDHLIVQNHNHRPGNEEAMVEARKHINTAFTGDAPDQAKQILMEACAKGNEVIAKAKR
jgi:ABC-type glycerol-3-phosphate transport system substrate-binding protein